MTDEAQTTEVKGTLEALTPRAPFIDLSPSTSVSANLIVSIEVVDQEIRDYWKKQHPSDFFSEIDNAKTVVTTPWRQTLSTLTYKELRNRLRKAGVTFI